MSQVPVTVEERKAFTQKLLRIGKIAPIAVVVTLLPLSGAVALWMDVNGSVTQDRTGDALVLYTIVASVIAVEVFLASYYRMRFLRNHGLWHEPMGAWAKRTVAGLARFVAYGFILVAVADATNLRGGWWLLPPATLAAYLIIFHMKAPRTLLRIRAPLEPMPAGELKERIEALCRKSGVPIREILVWKLSLTTRLGNAVAIGFGRWRRIIISDTLLALNSPEEVLAFCAHELGHHHFKSCGETDRLSHRWNFRGICGDSSGSKRE